MKRKGIILGLFLIGFLACFSIAYSQAETGDKLSRQEKKEKKVKEVARQKQATLEILKSRHFVIDATEIRNRFGPRMYLTPHMTFIAIDGTNATIQLSFDRIIGWMGEPAVTMEGHVTGFRLKEGKSGKPIQIDLRIEGPGIGSRQYLTVSPDGSASVDIIGDWGGQVTFIGDMIPLENSGIVKGNSPTY